MITSGLGIDKSLTFRHKLKNKRQELGGKKNAGL